MRLMGATLATHKSQNNMTKRQIVRIFNHRLSNIFGQTVKLITNLVPRAVTPLRNTNLSTRKFLPIVNFRISQ